MKVAKSILIFCFPIFLLYLLNSVILNKYPVFFPCFCGSAIYISNLDKIKSFKKLINNFLSEDKEELSNHDFINLVLIFILTVLFTWLIYILGKHDELGYPFGLTSIIFLLMSYFKFPRRFFY